MPIAVDDAAQQWVVCVGSPNAYSTLMLPSQVAHRPHPLDAARQALDLAAGVLTGVGPAIEAAGGTGLMTPPSPPRAPLQELLPHRHLPDGVATGGVEKRTPW